jgi:hypothetical protein
VTGAADDPQPAPTVDRDMATGRFVGGNQAARNHRAALHRRAVSAALADEGDPAKLGQVLSGLRAAAAAGDTKAAELWIATVIGKPRERAPDVDVSLPAAMTSREDFGFALTDLARCAAAGEIEPDAARSLATLLQQVAEVVVGDVVGSTEAVRRVVEQIVARRPPPPDALEQQRKLRAFLAQASVEAEGDQNATAENADDPLPEPIEDDTHG